VGGIEVARASVQSNRKFLVQVVRYLVLEAGVRQFLDIGTGIPTEDNVHTVAQQAAPESRIVYVDYDAIVLAHAHQLLRSRPEGATDFIHADLRDPSHILQRAEDTLDFGQPIALVLNAVLHHIPDNDNPHHIVARLLGGVPSGSYLAISHLTNDMQTDEMAALARSVPASARYRFAARSHAEVSRFFDGLELIEPGVVSIDRWRPDDPAAPPYGRYHYGGVARKP
jgi:hypothetical protein